MPGEHGTEKWPWPGAVNTVSLYGREMNSGRRGDSALAARPAPGTRDLTWLGSERRVSGAFRKST